MIGNRTAGNKIHELKILPEYFNAVIDGRKTFEIRKNDRDFAVGDTLVLKEWNQINRMPTGREQRCEITYILEGNEETKGYGLMKGFCIMSIMQKW